MPLPRKSSRLQFLSTLSLRRATSPWPLTSRILAISIHALLAESDGGCPCYRLPASHFYPRSPCGERQFSNITANGKYKFLSTLSLRRATASTRLCISPTVFLSTLSLRRATWNASSGDYLTQISIHALLAESDAPGSADRATSPDFYPRSPCGERQRGHYAAYGVRHFYPRSPCGERQPGRGTPGRDPGISIHALLAESDDLTSKRLPSSRDFYPRSPCGERRGGENIRPGSTHFYPRSPCGERRLYPPAAFSLL